VTVSLADATAAARRIQDGYAYMGDLKATDFEDDARLLAGFVLAGDTERLRTALERIGDEHDALANFGDVDWGQFAGWVAAVVEDALVEGGV
jgi:hypothetical protein